MCKFASVSSTENAQDLAANAAAWNTLHAAQAKRQQHEGQPAKRQREMNSAFDFALEFGASSYFQASSNNGTVRRAASTPNHNPGSVSHHPTRPQHSAAALVPPSVDKWRSQLDAGLTDVSTSTLVSQSLQNYFYAPWKVSNNLHRILGISL
jgi:hypothetical protein